MPVKPFLEWEQTAEALLLKVTIKGFKPDAVDVFISDTFVKVNASPTYLLQLDLSGTIDVQRSSFWNGDLPTLRLTLRKAAGCDGPWETLCIDPATPADEVRARRAAALERAEALYNTKLDTREKQKAVEKQRMLEAHWDQERLLRAEIAGKMKAEREDEAEGLHKWQQGLDAEAQARPRVFDNPGQVCLPAPPVRRGGETTNVSIDFSAGPAMQAPQRARGDEDYYRKSRYKPVSIEDAPMFWKEKADKLYRGRQWAAAADAYSESLKRDGCFLACVANRAACHLRLHEYERAIEDCDLAMTQLANTPASDTTQERYKSALLKLHIRRGAAHGWAGNTSKALEDYRMAAAYKAAAAEPPAPDHVDTVARDLDAIESYMRERGLVEKRDPAADARAVANRLYSTGRYADAVEAYRSRLAEDEFDVKARSNLASALLQAGRFEEALAEARRVLEFCQEVASALDEPGARSAALADSDDEDEAPDDGADADADAGAGAARDTLVRRKREAARTIRERSGHVYLLLKAYVRAAAALCGLRRYREAYEMFEQAVKITPYDDDLRDDANRVLEKVRMEAVVSSTAAANAIDKEKMAAAGQAAPVATPAA